jgi:MFS transporter, DHA2 family, multidrug resistance protein
MMDTATSIPATRSDQATQSDAVSVPALLAILASVGMVTLDISVANTALPTIAKDLSASDASVVWIINVYHLAMTAALLPLAALGEIVGHRRIFLTGLVAFTLASLACGLSGALPLLVAARVFQGLGAAAISGVTPALIRFLYPSHRLGRGLGIYASVVGVAFTVGPTAASAVLAVANWPFLFLINVPVGVIAYGLSLRTLPTTPRNDRRLDGRAAMLCAVFFGVLLLGLGEAAHGAAWMPIAVALVVAAISGVVLVRREAGQPAPILAVDLFRTPIFALSSATSICAFMVQGSAFVALPFLMHTTLGYSQVQIGLLITPWPAVVAVMALLTAMLADHIAPGLLGGFGLLLLGLGMASLALMPSSAGTIGLCVRLAACGVGFGLFQSPNMKSMMSSAPHERSGSASGIVAISRMLGQAFGAVIVALCLSLSPGRGAELALWVGCASALLGSLASFARLLAPAQPAPRA